MKVLVTGAASFIGGHLVDMLVERGDEVRALVRPVEDTSHLRTLTGVEIKHGDLTDAASLKRAMQGGFSIVLITQFVELVRPCHYNGYL